MSFYFETPQKRPRKAKQCRWCEEMCPPGKPRVVVGGIWEGDFFLFHFHPECMGVFEMWTFRCSDGWYPEETMQRGGLMTKEEAEALTVN